MKGLSAALLEKRRLGLSVAVFLIVALAVVATALVGELHSSRIIRVAGDKPYEVFSCGAGAQTKCPSFWKRSEYAVPVASQYFRIYFPASEPGSDNPGLEVYDSASGELLPSVSAGDAGTIDGRSYVQVANPPMREHLSAQFALLLRHKLLLAAALGLMLLFAGTLSAHWFSSRPGGRTRPALAAAFIASLVLFAVLSFSARFMGNALIVTTLMVFTVPLFFYAAVGCLDNWFWAGTPMAWYWRYGSFAGLVLLAAAFIATRGIAADRYLFGAKADYRSDFVVALSVYNGNGIGGLNMDKLPVDSAVKRFIDEAGQALPESEMDASTARGQLKSEATPVKCWGKRPYLFWTCGKLWQLLGVSWSVLDGIFFVLAAAAFLALLAALYSAGGPVPALVGGCFALVMPVDTSFIFCNTRNYAPAVAGCFILAALFCGQRWLFARHRNSCRFPSFWLLAMLCGFTAAWWLAWRSDVKQFMILLPLLAVAFGCDLEKRFIGWRKAALLVAALAAGVMLGLLVNRAVGRNLYDVTGQFHVAACGEDTRANIMNTSQNNAIFFLDSYVMQTVKSMSEGKYDYYKTPDEYDRACFTLYSRSLAAQARSYVGRIPQWIYEVCRTFFAEGSWRNPLAVISICGLFGCLLFSGWLGCTRWAIFASVCMFFAALFVVLPLPKHYVTLWPLMAFAVGIGLPGALRFFVPLKGRNLLIAACGILGVLAAWGVAFAVSAGLRSYALDTISGQLPETKLNIADFPEIATVGQGNQYFQISVSDKTEFSRLAARFRLKNVNDATRVYIVQEAISGDRKLWQNYCYGGAKEFNPRSDCEFITIFPVGKFWYSGTQRITLIVMSAEIDGSPDIFDAAKFSWSPTFSACIYNGEVALGEPLRAAKALDMVAWSLFISEHCKIDGGDLVLPYEYRIFRRVPVRKCSLQAVQ